jgi:hypothetical protein
MKIKFDHIVKSDLNNILQVFVDLRINPDFVLSFPL